MNWGYKLAITMGAFIVFIVGMGIRMSREKIDIVSEKYYLKSLNYNHQVDLTERGLVAAQRTKVSTNASHTCDFQWPPELFHAVGELKFYRPSDKNLDFTIPLDGDHNTQQVNHKNLINGLWHVQISWKKDQAEYYMQKEIWIQ
jgi:nitrogen fixation protein FixH